MLNVGKYMKIHTFFNRLLQAIILNYLKEKGYHTL